MQIHIITTQIGTVRIEHGVEINAIGSIHTIISITIESMAFEYAGDLHKWWYNASIQHRLQFDAYREHSHQSLLVRHISG